MCESALSRSMHVYLLVKPDYSEAFCYTSVKQAKQKEKELDYEPLVWEWMDCWGTPLYYAPNSDEDSKRDKSDTPLNMLRLAYESGNWFGRAKYPFNAAQEGGHDE
jgi:hypothetical protein